MKKIILVIIMLLVIGCRKVNYMEKYSEECKVIRKDDKIIGMKYIITFFDNMDLDEVIIIPRIYESIYHYVDVNKINSFDLYLEIHNNSKDNYYLKEILLNDKKKYNYNRIISNNKTEVIYYYLDKNFFNNYLDGFEYKLIFVKENSKKWVFLFFIIKLLLNLLKIVYT